MVSTLPTPFTEQIAFSCTGENSWTTVHPPQRMGHTLPIAYGGYALAVALKAAGLSVPQGYHIYSFMGNFLGPASTDKPLHVTTRTFRQTRTFATRHIEVSQEQDNEKPRVCSQLRISKSRKRRIYLSTPGPRVRAIVITLVSPLRCKLRKICSTVARSSQDFTILLLKPSQAALPYSTYIRVQRAFSRKTSLVLHDAFRIRRTAYH